MRATFLPLSGGDAGTLQTLEVMRRLAIGAHADPTVRMLAVRLAAQAGGGLDTYSLTTIARIRLYLERRVRFVRDPRYMEAVHDPRQLLTTIRARGFCAGDCDDVATVAAALGLSIGLRARFVAIGRAAFEHVYAELADPAGGPWRDIDTTRPWQTIPAAYQRRRLVYDV